MERTEPVYTLQKTLESFLYPEITPYEEGMLQVSDLHRLWFAQYGNPQGVPVVVFHGGPGFGCSPIDMRYFDPDYYRIILFDQRGAKRSIPSGELKENSTEELINDIEKLRKHLSIQKWLIFGGSWGSTLGLLYGESFAEQCLGFILRGVFLGRKADIHNTWYGIQDTYPESWDQLQNFLPAEEKKDLINSYYQRLVNPDPMIHFAATEALVNCILTCSYLFPSPEIIHRFMENKTLALGIARLFTYYSKNNFFIAENQILNHINRICHLPLIIIQGRYDLLCKAKSAYELHQNWPESELVFVQDAGHSALELGASKALVAATDKMKGILLS